MTATSNKQEEEAGVCSTDSLRELSKKENRILFISTNEDRREFPQKFVNSFAPKDLAVFDTRTDSSCEVVEHLGLKDKPAAVLIENGEVKARIELTNDDVKDTAGLTTMILERMDNKACRVKLVVDGKGWRVIPESSEQCKIAVSNLEKQGPATKKYLKKHISLEGSGETRKQPSVKTLREVKWSSDVKA